MYTNKILDDLNWFEICLKRQKFQKDIVCNNIQSKNWFIQNWKNNGASGRSIVYPSTWFFKANPGVPAVGSGLFPINHFK